MGWGRTATGRGPLICYRTPASVIQLCPWQVPSANVPVLQSLSPFAAIAKKRTAAAQFLHHRERFCAPGTYLLYLSSLHMTAIWMWNRQWKRKKEGLIACTTFKTTATPPYMTTDFNQWKKKQWELGLLLLLLILAEICVAPLSSMGLCWTACS